MAFIDSVLEPPSYGWKDADGNLSKPNPARIFREFISRLNVFKDKKKLALFYQLDDGGGPGCLFIVLYF